MIQTHEQKTIKSDFIIAQVENGQVKGVSLHTPLPMSPDGFEKVIKDLHELRKVLWPNYVDATTQSISIEMPKTTKETRYTGKVKWFNDAKGIGFITTTDDNDGSQDVFVHFTSIQKEGFRTLAEGERVSFVIRTGVHGKSAYDVRPE